MAGGFDRRRFLAGTLATPLAAAFAAPAGLAQAAGGQRLAVLDWALLECLLALGTVPVAAVELVLFRKLAVEPTVPPQVIDLGLRGSFNLELLASLRPDAIYVSPFNSWAMPLIEPIAPLRFYEIFGTQTPPFEQAITVTRQMGDALGRAAEAQSYIADTKAELEAARQALAGRASRPVYLINLGDARHARVFGPDSLFGSIMAAMGLQNAFSGPTRYAASAPVGIEAMAERPDAAIVIVGPIPPDAEAALEHSVLWQAIPAVASGRAHILPNMNAFGALPTARRFIRLLSASLGAQAA
ncbi:iron-siderophore ABC transporter substrate-binding protein [Aureimonas frigidaquae]|uniref:ABC-type Fe3+-hydroxamate transport system, periplasmic component n=1 Tax=Aureimonas frigidaquae TaxID=424757 RepID=A0A0P0Z406_9HYPH|nr:iron-siderophore ABC transporter substrate-binding protein [Aureimonas frigidaquae]BAT28765.1 ABC-type Fe3+-hydroxamate transport system, periplasmic component precursor [Aureimonas frigidaquae]